MMSRILVVEDSLTALYVVSDLLVKDGYEVLKATDGEEAVRLAVQEQPNLILLDVILPKLNGFQVCRQIKATPETQKIPVVMITSKSKTTDRHWGIEQGADGYVVKPVDIDQLRAVVGQFIESKG